MEKVINYENLSYYAYSNDKDIKGDIRGVVIEFFGLGCQAMYHSGTDTGKFYASKTAH